MNKTILQKEITLDEALIKATEPFPNGCRFRVLFDKDNLVWLEYGCYPLFIVGNRPENLLKNWLENEPPMEKLIRILEKKSPRRLLTSVVSPETLMEIKKKEPCIQCGAPWFQKLAAYE